MSTRTGVCVCKRKVRLFWEVGFDSELQEYEAADVLR